MRVLGRLGSEPHGAECVLHLSAWLGCVGLREHYVPLSLLEDGCCHSVPWQEGWSLHQGSYWRPYGGRETASETVGNLYPWERVAARQLGQVRSSFSSSAVSQSMGSNDGLQEENASVLLSVVPSGGELCC